MGRLVLASLVIIALRIIERLRHCRACNGTKRRYEYGKIKFTPTSDGGIYSRPVQVFCDEGNCNHFIWKYEMLWDANPLKALQSRF